MKKGLLLTFWASIIVAIIGLISSAIVALINNPIQQIPNSTPSSLNNFNYQIRIETKTREPIESATVIIEIGEIAPLDDVSDATGLARIFFDKEYVGKPARLIVKASGYKTFTQAINLTEGALPKIIQLELAP